MQSHITEVLLALSCTLFCILLIWPVDGYLTKTCFHIELKYTLFCWTETRKCLFFFSSKTQRYILSKYR